MLHPKNLAGKTFGYLTDLKNVCMLIFASHSLHAQQGLVEGCEEFPWNESATYGVMFDQDGNEYRTIQIGEQKWMAEDLRTTHYRNGDEIPIVTDDDTWSQLTTGATCWYNNDSANFSCPYSRLYNWYASTDSRKLCPSGWRSPGDHDWNLLAKEVDPDSDTLCINCSQTTSGGQKLKSENYWAEGDMAETNATGFSAVGAGYRISNGTFYLLFSFTIYQCVEVYTENFVEQNVYARTMGENSGDLYRGVGFKRMGTTARCIADSADVDFVFERETRRLNIYPNPASSYIYIDLSKQVPKGKIELILSDVNGVSCLKQEVQTGADKTYLEVSTLPAGYYLLTTNVDGINTHIGRFVKVQAPD